MNRRDFIGNSTAFSAALLLSGFQKLIPSGELYLMSVTGKISQENTGIVLPHEHVLVDFIGAEKVNPSRYNREEAFRVILPFLQQAKDLGCKTFMECTPAFVGRDVVLLKKLAEATGLNILTNTGLYGTKEGKYLPPYVFTETAEQLAIRWIDEAQHGIEGTGIRPGFIKTSVDNAPIRDYQRKLLKAASITHLATGLTIVSHCTDVLAVHEQIDILQENEVHPSAFIWAHAQTVADIETHLSIAKTGAWISYDGLAPDSILHYIELVKNASKNNYLPQVILSHDSGWFRVGETDQSKYRGYDTLFTKFIPALKKEGFTETDINRLVIENPARAFAIQTRKTKVNPN